MNIKTFIGKVDGDSHEMWVSTSESVYRQNGNYYTILSLRSNRHNGIRLLSYYSQTQEEASKMHLEYASKAKELLSIGKKNDVA